MNIRSLLEALRGMPLLEEISSGALTRADLDDLGFRDAGRWEMLARVYFGPTRHRRLQKAARAAAAGLSIDAVAVVEKHTRKLLRGAAVSEWELRVELCALRGTVAEIDVAAAARVRELNRGVDGAEKKAFANRALRGGKNTDAHGSRSAHITGPERHMAALFARLRPTAERLRREDPRLTHDQAMFDALMSLGGGPVDPAAMIPHVVMAVPDYAKVLRHEGDETIFALTDGTMITGKELIAREFASHGLVGIYDPVKGGVNLYRDERFANFKQRMLLAAETILCPHPGCTTPASQCQVHHMTAWEKGGNTNIGDMTMLCKVHNARNDDDPDKPPRHGRVEREPGGVVHYPPDGGPPRTNTHPIRKLSAMALINK